jgi:hypothetical protein
MKMGASVGTLIGIVLAACGGDGAGTPGDAGADLPAADTAPSLDTGEALPDGALPETSDALPDTSEAVPEVTAEVIDDAGSDAAAPEIDDVDDAEGGDTAEGDADNPLPWRSALYPADWVPGTSDSSGAMLQDYSYAGYHHGEEPLGAGLGGRAALPRWSVIDFGALAGTPPASDSTAAFQAAIDAAEASGGVVYVPAGLYRLDGRLVVEASRVVIAGDGAASRLWFTQQEGMSYAAHLAFAGRETVTAEALLVRSTAPFETFVEVDDAGAFAPGDDVLVGQVITDSFVAEHGMTGTWQAFNGTWQAFFRRTVKAVDRSASPPRVTLDVPLRFALETAHGASLRRVEGVLREVGLEHLAIANATDWEGAWAGDQVNAVAFERVADAWIADLTSFPSPGAPESGMGAGAHLQSNGLLVSQSKRVTVADSHLAKAQHRGSGGNGYLFEIRQSSEVLTRDSSAREGRHNFIQNWGFGTTGCVWLRVLGADGASVPLGPLADTPIPAPSELHHSLATANLFDQSRFDDGFEAVNRGSWSSGAGHTGSECVFWNVAGREVISAQYGRGYVIGSAPGTVVSISLALPEAAGTAPEDWVEGLGSGPWLEPASLYEDQLARRRAR